MGASGSQYYLSSSFPWGEQGFDFTYTNSTCTPSAPCTFNSVGMKDPAQISIDSYNNLFMEEYTTGALEMPVSSYAAGSAFALNLWHLADRYAYWNVNPGAFAVNPPGNTLFTFFTYATSNTCYILSEPLYGANITTPLTPAWPAPTPAASPATAAWGRRRDRFAVGQMAFDAAGDLYFTDTNNQRVRRIDYNTGIIRTMAGNGTAGYTGDGIGGIGAELASPTGVGVDSQGQIYIISGAAATGTAQEVRKVTTVGYRNFGYVVKGTKATFTPIIVTNTGNFPLQITNTSFTGPNAAEFAIDPTITTCALTPGATLAIGQTCQIGFTATPAAAGTRTAYFNLLDNSVTGVNVVDLYATGILPSATFKITSPSNGASYTSGTAVPFKVSVTSGSGPAPTGTVQFKVDGANFGSAVTLASGAASTNVTGLSVTSHTLSATYSGDTNYAAGGPISVSITVTGTVPPPAVMLVPMMSTANYLRTLVVRGGGYRQSGVGSHRRRPSDGRPERSRSRLARQRQGRADGGIASSRHLRVYCSIRRRWPQPTRRLASADPDRFAVGRVRSAGRQRALERTGEGCAISRAAPHAHAWRASTFARHGLRFDADRFFCDNSRRVRLHSTRSRLSHAGSC